MAAYRFCRTDDIALLADALNRCWSPYFPDEPPMTPAVFKRSIRDLQVWCSSCMVAFSGSDPIGVLIGAKRPTGTLVHKIAVHPDHRRLGHAHHLLASLGSKLAILGPARIVAEVPETFGAACGLFSASGFARETILTDYVLRPEAHAAREDEAHAAPEDEAHAGRQDEAHAARERVGASDGHNGLFVIPVTVDDLAANGLLGEADPQVCWRRSVETLIARKDDIAGLAVASEERIEAYVLYAKCGASAPDVESQEVETMSLRSFIEDGGARLKQLLSRLVAQGVFAQVVRTLRFPKVHPSEISLELLETFGFRPAGGHLLYAARAMKHTTRAR
jgi:ribosomal protein S18 acetylase RimI-like enzyme